MFAVYADGTLQELKFGQKIVGLQKNRHRPVSFRITQTEIDNSSLSQSQRERYTKMLNKALACT